MTSKCGDFFKTRKPLKIVGMVLGGIILAAVMAFLLGWVIMLLWNWLMPALFGLGTINYWQGFGILFLAKLLFGFGSGHSSDSGNKKDKKGTIKGEIGNEIKKEFKKEFEKEFEKEFNSTYEEKYEKWWSTEGRVSFEEYMKSKASPEESSDPES